MTILKRAARDNWSAPLGRTAVWTVVLVLHAAMLLLFTHAARRTPRDDEAETRSSAIMLRLVLTAIKPAHEASKPKVLTKTDNVKTRTRSSNRHATTPVAIAATPTPAAISPTETINTIDWNLPNTTAPVTGSFTDQLNAARQQRPVAHLPGSSVPLVKGLHMTDPRNQGLAGAVRTLQSILGAVNPHCMDVDVWRKLSTQELLDRHISPSEVANTAEKYRCADL